MPCWPTIPPGYIYTMSQIRRHQPTSPPLTTVERLNTCVYRVTTLIWPTTRTDCESMTSQPHPARRTWGISITPGERSGSRYMVIMLTSPTIRTDYAFTMFPTQVLLSASVIVGRGARPGTSRWEEIMPTLPVIRPEYL